MSTAYHTGFTFRELTVFICFFFFFQAEDGIRDWSVTGVQTCALPISSRRRHTRQQALPRARPSPNQLLPGPVLQSATALDRSAVTVASPLMGSEWAVGCPTYMSILV